MENRFRYRLLAVIALVVLLIPLGISTHGVAANGEDDQQQPPQKRHLIHPVLGSHLNDLVAQLESGNSTPRQAAERASVHLHDSVGVTIHLSSHLDEVVQFLRDYGADPRNVGQDFIEAYVPVSLLGPLSHQPGVVRIREIIPPQPALGNVVSQGAQLHGAPVWNQAGFNGQGVKLGIIDIGFEGFADFMNSELPGTVVARCYTSMGRFTENPADCEFDGDHGTRVAQTAADIAPQATLYIANPTTKADLQASAQWMVSEGVSVINHSVVWIFDGPGDGTSLYEESPLNTIDQVVDGGAVWVNAAGNSASNTWFQSNPQTNEHGFVNFGGSDISNGISLGAGEYLTVQLRWEDDWSGTNRDFDLFIREWWSGRIVASSEDIQSGRPGHEPIEVMAFVPDVGGTYEILVNQRSGRVPPWIQLMIWRDTPFLSSSPNYYTLSGSINNPAESSNQGMLAVGAAHWQDVHTVEEFSSRGPTPDGRVKPDVVGVDCGNTARSGFIGSEGSFCGTSQAAPHLAGMAALVRQRFPELNPEGVVQYLMDFSDPRGRVPNNSWGYGLAKLPALHVASPPPRISSDDCATGGAVEDPLSNPGLVSDCFTLLHFRDVLAEHVGLNWAGNTPINSWSGVFVSGTPARVTGLDLWRTGLSGKIPAELGNLDQLVALYLTSNNLTGEIPPELGNLENLRDLRLRWNQLSGSIPPELGNLTNLTTLELDSNHLSGRIPPELGKLDKLETLWLGSNQLTGQIPAELGNLHSLKYLYLSNNELTGEIPPEVASIGDLRLLQIGRNRLTGKIPAELGNISTLTWLEIDSNQLSGEIPRELGNLANLDEIWLNDNSLTGDIPAELGHLSNLHRLRLGNNQMTGRIPAELGNLTNLNDLSLVGNQLEGCIPPVWQGIQRNDLSLLGLPYCGVSEVPTPPLPPSPPVAPNPPASPAPPAPPAAPDPPGLREPGTDPCITPLGTFTKVVVETGAWTGACASSGGRGGYARYFTFLLGQDAEVSIELSSSVDTYLYLREGEGRLGTVLHENDNVDSGSTDSTLRETLAAGGYTIEVTTSLPGRTGTFTLTITELGPSLGTTDPCSETISRDGINNGEWVSGCDSQEEGRGYARYYSFTLDRESAVRIELISSLDTYLYLREGEARSGTALHENDDIEEGVVLDSRIDETLAGGTYTIEATTFASGQTGSFTLRVSGLDTTQGSISVTPANGPPGTVATLTGEGFKPYLPVERVTIGSIDITPAPRLRTDLIGLISFNIIIPDLELGIQTIEAQVGNNLASTGFTVTESGTPGPVDACGQRLSADGLASGRWSAGCDSQERDGSYARFYTFTLAEPREVSIRLESEVDTYLYLRAGEAKSGAFLHENDDIESGNTDSRIVAALAAGTYTLEATTFHTNRTGSFTLTVSGLAGTTGPDPDPDPGDICSHTLSGDGSINGEWIPDCQSSVPNRGYALYYTFTLAQQSQVTLDLESSADTYLYLRAGETAQERGLPARERRHRERQHRLPNCCRSGSWDLHLRSHHLPYQPDRQLHPDRQRAGRHNGT